MSKAIYVCSRNTRFDKDSTEKKLFAICNALTPDNVTSSIKHTVKVKENNAYAVTISNRFIQESDQSLLLGMLYEEAGTNWAIPEQNYPDGNYAIFRNDYKSIEVLSDCAGSRTIWFYHDEDLFIASTSQRAIILFLGSFSFNENVIPWMLSSGTLGPDYSWDKRLKRIQADSSVLLDKKTWHLTLRQNEIDYIENTLTNEEYQELLLSAIKKTIRYLKSIDFKKCVLSLSGGVDSRTVLYIIKDQIGIPEGFRTVTWGLEDSVNIENSDAAIANKLSHVLGVRHIYLSTDISCEPIEVIIDRYLINSEGRIDHLAGYMDGMEIWRKFHDEKVELVIRGDRINRSKQEYSDLHVRHSVGMELCEDFSNLKNVCADIGLPPQHLPPAYNKKKDESLSAYGKRLRDIYRKTTIQAALSDIKFSYVEQVNPLLSRSISAVMRCMPDQSSAEYKTMIKNILKSIGPDLPFAHKGSTAKLEDILRDKPFVMLLNKEINSPYAHNLLGSKFVNYILNAIEDKPKTKKTIKKKGKMLLKFFFPMFVQKHNQEKLKTQRPKLDSNLLAFRVLIIIKMHKMLNKIL